MAATQTAVSDGTLNILNVSIPYFEQDDISVAFGQTTVGLGTVYRWNSAASIEFLDSTEAPGGRVPSGTTVLLRRTTQDDEMYNIFDGSAAFSRAALDENFKQLLYREQEFSEGLGINGLHSDLDMNGYHITNLGDGTADGDAVNLGQMQAADAQEAADRAAADANLQDQLTGNVPLEASAFSEISWHGQSIDNSVTIPENKNAWSFGPSMTIANGSTVTVSAGSHWTIANGQTVDDGTLNLDSDYGEL